MNTDPYADFPARTESVRSWIANTLICGYALNFSTLGARRNLFTINFDGCLYNHLLDGHCSKADWAVSNGERRSDRLFAAMGELAKNYPTSKILIQCHDDAYFGEPIIVPTLPERYHRAMLYMLQRNPADEAGTTYLGFLHEDFQGLVLFTDGIRHEQPPNYPRGFDVDFYGTEQRLRELLSALEIKEAEQVGDGDAEEAF